MLRPNAKRKFKDRKFGFGGKKKGTKWNTKESHNDMSGFRPKVAHGKGGKAFGKGGKKQNVSIFQVDVLPLFSVFIYCDPVLICLC